MIYKQILYRGDTIISGGDSCDVSNTYKESFRKEENGVEIMNGK